MSANSIELNMIDKSLVYLILYQAYLNEIYIRI